MNGNGFLGKVVLWAIGALFTLICVVAIPTMAKSIWENDRLSRNRDTEMQKELSESKQAFTKELGSVKEQMAAQTIRLEYLDRNIIKNGTVQEKILSQLEKMNNG